jgi:hypothetical protein
MLLNSSPVAESYRARTAPAGYCCSMTRARVLPAVFGRCRKMSSGGGGGTLIPIAGSRCRTPLFPCTFSVHESREA